MQSSIVKFVWLVLISGAVFTLISVFWNYLKSRHIKALEIKSREDLTNIKISLVNAGQELLMGVLGFSILAAMLYPLSSILPFQISWSPFSFVLCLILTDFCYYLSHLTDHKIQFFWNQHCVHHSSEAFSLSTGYRKSWIAFLVNWIFYLPVGFLGFPPEMVLLNLALITSFTHFLHTERISKVPFFEYIFNTPKSHRIHHSAYESHIDKNMAGIFMIWDHVFGTFSLSDGDKVIYGLTKPLNKTDIWYINFQEWIWLKNVFKQKGFKKMLRALFSSPEGNKDLHAEIN